MELEAAYQDLLIEIHESKNERFENEFVEQKSRFEKPDLKETLSYLIEKELVEFDVSENAYYLTYEGYEEVEGIKLLRKTGEEFEEIEYQHVLKKPRNESIKSIIGGVLTILFAVFAYLGVSPNEKFKLSPELLNQIKDEVSLKKDSMINQQLIIQVNKAWDWYGITAEKIIDVNEFGNIIFSDKKDEIYRICPEELSIVKIAKNIIEFELLRSQDEFILDWEMKDLVILAKSKLGEISNSEKYCLKIPAVISSDYSKDNIGKISFSELISVCGDLAFQIKDLEDGQKIELKIED